VQADQADHALTTQLTGQFWVLQFCVCVNTGHAAPPYAAATRTVRVWRWVPVPHVLSQADQADQALTTQLTAHGWVLQACSCVRAGHGTPPKAAATATVRVDVCRPRPQVLEQADHAAQPLTTQLTGHGCVLQLWDCDNAGHAVPPCAAATVTVRVCVCTPPPHVLEQADHADQPLTTHWMGQGWELQICDSDTAGQATPPNAGCVVTGRVRV